MAIFEILIIVIGIAYGYLKPGKEDRKVMLKKGLIIGLILAVIFAALGILIGKGGSMMFIGGSVVGIMSFISVLILTVFFIIGTFIGDWLEENLKK